MMLTKTLLSLAISCALLGIAQGANENTLSPLQAGEAAIATGHINNAISLLQQAQKTAKTPQEGWLASTALAEALIRAGQLEAAETELNQTYQAAKTSATDTLLGDIELRYGHLYAARIDHEKAENWYQQALTHALKANDSALAAAASINLAKHNGLPEALATAQKHIANVPAGELHNSLVLSLAYEAIQQNSTQLAYDSLQAVLEATHNERLKAQALGYLGQLYEHEQRYAEALQLTDQALVTDSDPDLHLVWNWQRARILVQQNNPRDALIAYRSAVQQLQGLRADIPVTYNGGQSSFKQTFAPMYLGFIDLLLKQATKGPNDTTQSLLNEVLQTWEQLKAVELQDYFRDACSVKQKSHIAQLDDHTAVLYPILLNDHLALILRSKNNIRAYHVNHTPAEVDSAVEHLNEQIFSNVELTETKKLYNWLIEPIVADLKQHEIDTLVYLPDGALRKIPFSLLHDGKGYLVEQYALVTVPGLSMLAAPSASKARQDILLAGMSKPGPVVDELLDSGINLFDPPKEETRGLSKRALYFRSATNASRSLAERNLRTMQLQEELVLPGVTEELKELGKLTEHPAMENDNFLLANFTKSVNQGHSAVHIASHGYFSGDPKKSFIMAYDHLLTMEQLTTLFQTEAFHDRPIELVTLSACQTAEGDDRSPLGLSGVVVQTGVKSAIGTLWPVADEAARQFFSDFYAQYQISGMTKAKAMQYAQKKLMQNPKLNNPAYWGPFVLVGEWH